MIRLTKLNEEVFIINCSQIEGIESIPESKVVLMNGKHFVVKESMDEIVDKVIAHYAQIISSGIRSVREVTSI